MENKKLTCSDCKREFVCEYNGLSFHDEAYSDLCDCNECEHCFEVSCENCAYDGYQWLCKKCQAPPVPKTNQMRHAHNAK